LLRIEHEHEILFILTIIEGTSNMSDKTTGKTFSEDVEFNTAFGWLAALAVSIASWAGLAS
jgi:hypothetical protein